MKRTIRNQTGFTLIELLIATMISAIVLAAIMEVFATNYKSYLLQDDVANMQENLRVGMSFLDRDVTMIGSGMVGVDKAGGYNIVRLVNGVFQSQQAFPLTFQNNAGDIDGLTADPSTGLFPDGQGGSDRLIVRYNDFAQGCGSGERDFDDGKGKVDVGVMPCDKLPQLTLFDRFDRDSNNNAGAVTRVEEVTASRPNGCPSSDPTSPCFSMYSKWNESCYCGDTLYDAPTPYFYAIVTSPDMTSSDMLVVTQVVGGNTSGGRDGIQNRPYSGFDNKVLGTYNPGSRLSFFNARTYREVMYYVQNGELRRRITTLPPPGGAAVAPQDQPIAENIEDLQFALGIDNNNNGTIEADEWVNNMDIDGAASLPVRMVRINLIGRAEKPNSTFYTDMQQTIKTATGSPSDTVEDRSASDIEALAPTVAQKDRFYMRKMLQTTVKVRSLGLQ